VGNGFSGFRRSRRFDSEYRFHIPPDAGCQPLDLQSASPSIARLCAPARGSAHGSTVPFPGLTADPSCRGRLDRYTHTRGFSTGKPRERTAKGAPEHRRFEASRRNFQRVSGFRETSSQVSEARALTDRAAWPGRCAGVSGMPPAECGTAVREHLRSPSSRSAQGKGAPGDGDALLLFPTA
jgi:hypothetical protein